MLTTMTFRLDPSPAQKILLNEIFVVYNRMKRKGYQLLFKGAKRIQQKLMQLCHNNPYVNTIMTENETKLDQQRTWLKKREQFLRLKIEVVKCQIGQNKEKNPKDRSLKGLYSLLSSLQNRLAHLTLRPVVFGTKSLFQERIRGKMSKEEFIIRRDASFGCVGKAQDGVQNNNLKILPNETLRISTFQKTKGTIPKRICVPLAVNSCQRAIFQKIRQMDKYTVVVNGNSSVGNCAITPTYPMKLLNPPCAMGFRTGRLGWTSIIIF